MSDNRANLSNVNIDYAKTTRDDISYEGAIFRVGDNRANLPNAIIDCATTSRDNVSYEGAIFEWAIIGQTSRTLLLAMQRLPEMT